jgi:hypothetical protein
LLSGDGERVKQELARYKDNGIVNMRKVLEVPMNERIPALLQHPANYEPVYTALVAALSSSLSLVSVGAGMNEDQVLELAKMILESAKEDNLGLEDVLLFLGELVTGKTGTIYNRLDIPTFFELFEGYRQRRYKAIRDYREEEHAQFNALPVDVRFVAEDNQAERERMRRAVSEYYLQQQSGDKT